MLPVNPGLSVRGLSKNRLTLVEWEYIGCAQKNAVWGCLKIPVGKNYRKSEHCCDNWYLTGSVVRDNNKVHENQVSCYLIWSSKNKT